MTVRHSPIRAGAIELVVTLSVPDSPVFALQVICQVASAVTGQVPAPAVRSASERSR
jgi:hypothetical protein